MNANANAITLDGFCELFASMFDAQADRERKRMYTGSQLWRIASTVSDASCEETLDKSFRNTFKRWSATDKGSKERKLVASTWNSLRTAICNAATEDGFTVKFPKLNNPGDDKTTVMLADEARNAAKIAREKQEEIEAQARAEFLADQKQQQLDELRALGPEELADSLMATMQAWSDNPSSHVAVLDALYRRMKDNAAAPVEVTESAEIAEAA